MKHRRKIITTGALWSEKLAGIDHAAERLYWRIYMASDNYGVMSGKSWDVCQQATPGVTGFTPRTVEKAIDTLVLVGLLEKWSEPEGGEFVFVVGHDDHQAADFLRKRGNRRSPKPPSMRDDAHNTSVDAVPCPSRENGIEGHEHAAHTTTTTTPTELRDTSTSAEPKRDIKAEAQQVFDHWVQVWNKRPTTVFDHKRRRAVVGRLSDGYTADDLMAAISGYRHSDHHMTGKGGKPYDELELFMRDAAHVDSGMSHVADGASSNPVTAGILAGLQSLGGAA